MAVTLLAGPIAVGKSSVARALAQGTNTRLVSARELLITIAGANLDRSSLQRTGRTLDQRTNGRWLLEALVQAVEESADGDVLVDSARTVRQTEPVLESLTQARLIYLHADLAVRRERFEASARQDPVKRYADFIESNADATEQRIPELRSLAHQVIDTSGMTLATTAQLIADEILLEQWPRA